MKKPLVLWGGVDICSSIYHEVPRSVQGNWIFRVGHT